MIHPYTKNKSRSKTTCNIFNYLLLHCVNTSSVFDTWWACVNQHWQVCQVGIIKMFDCVPTLSGENFSKEEYLELELPQVYKTAITFLSSLLEGISVALTNSAISCMYTVHKTVHVNVMQEYAVCRQWPNM